MSGVLAIGATLGLAILGRTHGWGWFVPLPLAALLASNPVGWAVERLPLRHAWATPVLAGLGVIFIVLGLKVHPAYLGVGAISGWAANGLRSRRFIASQHWRRPTPGGLRCPYCLRRHPPGLLGPERNLRLELRVARHAHPNWIVVHKGAVTVRAKSQATFLTDFMAVAVKFRELGLNAVSVEADGKAELVRLR